MRDLPPLGGAGRADRDPAGELGCSMNAMPAPGLHFLEVGHDDDCPGRYTDGEGCCCKVSLTLHSDVNRYLRGEATNRAARRKAAREAEKALRKARRATR